MCFCLVRCCPVLYSLCSPKYIGPKEGCMSWYRHIMLGLTHLSEHGGACAMGSVESMHGPPAAASGSCRPYPLVAPASSNPPASRGHQPTLCRQLHHTTASATPLSPNFGASYGEQNRDVSIWVFAHSISKS